MFLDFGGKAQEAGPEPAPSPFATESLVGRLTRLAGILRVCCAGGQGTDVGRAVKVLEKLKQVRSSSAPRSSVRRAITNAVPGPGGGDRIRPGQ